MPFYLKYDGVNDRLDVPLLTLGVNDYVEIVITDYTGKGGVYHFLTDSSSDTNRLFFGVRTTNRIEIPSGTAVLVNGTPVANDGLFTSVMNGADHTVRITNTAGTKTLGRIGSRFNNVETWPGGIKSITVSIGGVVTTWNGNAVDTSSTTWAPVSGSTNLTLVNFTLPAAWIFYSSGATITSTAAWSITPMQWQGSAAVSAPTFSSTAAWSVSPMRWQGAANATPPVFNSVTAWSISPLQWQAAAASTAPGAIVNAVAWTINPLQWQAAAQPAPAVQSSAAWSISQLNWQGTASATVPAFTASAAWSISPMQWQAGATATAPGATASTVNWSISPMLWQGSVAATVPAFNASAAWTISPMVWQVSASIAGAPVFAAKGATITERFSSHAIIERLQTARIYE
jgi:hypothetical protein